MMQKPKVRKNCTYCGSIYEASRADTRFCSNNCYAKARKAAAAGMSYEAYKKYLKEVKRRPKSPNQNTYTRVCQYCGVEFISKRPEAKWCTQRCLCKANAARQKGVSYEEYEKNHANDELLLVNRMKKKELQKPKKKLSHLDQMVQEADAMGMSYGQYKAHLATKGVK